MTNRDKITKLSLYNSDGELIEVLLTELQDPNLEKDFNLWTLPTELYSLIIKTQNGNYILKFIKQ